MRNTPRSSNRPGIEPEDENVQKPLRSTIGY